MRGERAFKINSARLTLEHLLSPLLRNLWYRYSRFHVWKYKLPSLLLFHAQLCGFDTGVWLKSYTFCRSKFISEDSLELDRLTRVLSSCSSPHRTLVNKIISFTFSQDFYLENFNNSYPITSIASILRLKNIFENPVPSFLENKKHSFVICKKKFLLLHERNIELKLHLIRSRFALNNIKMCETQFICI